MTVEEFMEEFKKNLQKLVDSTDEFEVLLYIKNDTTGDVWNSGNGCPGCTVEQILFDMIRGKFQHIGNKEKIH